MTVDLEKLRSHIGPGPSDDVLEDALAAALEAIENRYGPEGDAREYLRPFGQWVKLGRRTDAVDTVLESGTEVAPEDYEIWPGSGGSGEASGRYLRRLRDLEPTSWTGMVEVTYTPLSESAERDRVTIALVQFGLDNPGALTGITVGPWSEQYQQRSPGDITLEREAILASLRARSVGTW